MMASYRGRPEAVPLLLHKGSNKAAVSYHGDNAFSLATGPQKAALQALLKP